jgi:apolipoprotein N-acyltransferase
MIWYALLCFGVFVLLTTWWIYYATPIGPPATLIVNGGYMTLTFLVFHQVRRRLGDRLGYASFVAFWLAFEFLYLRAQINFPWLILGNGFANDVTADPVVRMDRGPGRIALGAGHEPAGI